MRCLCSTALIALKVRALFGESPVAQKEISVPLYTIIYFDSSGEEVATTTGRFVGDDDAIEAVGQSTHPYSIDIFAGDRRVARCPPLLFSLLTKPNKPVAE